MHLEERTFGELRDLADSVVLVAVAVDVGIFEALGKGAASAEELAAELGFDETATLVLLEALVGVGALERDAQLFRPTERTDRELCDPDLATYAGRGMPHWLRALGARTRLGEVLRGGGPLRPRLSARAPEDAARFTAAMAAAPRRRVERIVDLCLERNPGARSVLDVGGGPGHMTRAFARRGLRATRLDTPDIIAHVVGAHRLGEVANLEVFPADFTRDPLPAGPFDVVLISNVLHIYGPEQNRRLVRDVARVSAPDAVVAVAEFLRGRSRRAPDLSLRMLMTSESGKAYSEAEISSWLDEAGFGERRVDSLDEDRQLVTAVLGSAPRD
ncbi:MAG TPA: class I SAM-dependent methyltransferase [Longimicrobiales bacterium]|nr:class I SAM-dependent methyltransferase [Longimicrobiales bacterium]